ncbi:hypothetical protein AnigIFM56816_005922 [Aspergillus niger]|nr:hypothetical protein AnigIFM56816_005922 [Aspergillus niger]
MFGYDVDPNASPRGWGHITADGTIANLESIWVARNLKYYPLSLYLAIKKGKLQFLAGKFTIENCQGESKVFDEMTAWELLNLRPDTVLGIPQCLYDHHNISNDFLDKVMVDYNIQNISKSELEEEFLETDVINDVKFPFRYMVGKTRHYSWPKGAAIAGLGSDFMYGIKVDFEARLDIEELRKELQTCFDERRPVYGVVAIMGSTEEGAVDNLKEIVKMRDDFKKMGMSFLLHADAAWGGYFATMLPRGKELEQQAEDLKRQTTSKGFAPSLTLKQRTAEDLRALKYLGLPGRLRNVVMSPFPTDMKFIDELMREFKKVVMQEVIVSRERNKCGRQQASFLMQGTDEVFLVYQPSFHEATKREQVIVAADIWHKDDYVSLKRSGKYKQITLESHHNINLEKKIKMLAWKSSGSPTTEQDKKENKGEAEDHTLGEAEPEIPEEETLSHYPHFHDSSDRLDRRLFFLGHIYADGHSFTLFYLYGTENQAHISHMMLRAPDVSLTADNVHLDQATKDKIKDKLGQGLILGLTDYPEAAMQPIHEPLPEGFFSRKHSTDLRVKVWEDPNKAWAEGPGLLGNLGTAVAEGTMSLGNEVQVDTETVNYDPNGSVPPDPSGWQQEFDAIGSVLNTNWPAELTVREKGLPN